MDQRNIEKTMSIRKTIREILKELETATKLANCPAFKKVCYIHHNLHV